MHNFSIEEFEGLDPSSQETALLDLDLVSPIEPECCWETLSVVTGETNEPPSLALDGFDEHEEPTGN